MAYHPRIELLQAEVDEDNESFFRLLVDGRIIKYITIEPGLYSSEDMCFGPSLVSILPEFPPGDWNDGRVAKDPTSSRPHFASVNMTEFPGVQNTWHETYIDYFDLSIGRKLRTGIYQVTCPRFDKAAVAKFARFPWEIQYMENETTAYQWLSGHDIGPHFLGHLTEHGRVIGFIMEYIPDARHAGAQDVETCGDALSRLHALGVRHGDVNRFNFLISGLKATLIDFDTARKCEDQDVLRQEMESLRDRLNEDSNRGGGGLL